MVHEQEERRHDRRHAATGAEDKAEADITVRAGNNSSKHHNNDDGREHQSVDKTVDGNRGQHAAHRNLLSAGDEP